MITLYDYLDSGNGYKARLLLAQLLQGPCTSSLLWLQVLLKSTFGIQERELLRDDGKPFLLRY